MVAALISSVALLSNSGTGRRAGVGSTHRTLLPNGGSWVGFDIIVDAVARLHRGVRGDRETLLAGHWPAFSYCILSPPTHTHLHRRHTGTPFHRTVGRRETPSVGEEGGREGGGVQKVEK